MTSSTSNTVILVVDDDTDIREALTEVLQDEGFRVKTATNGDQALSELRSEPIPHLVFLDLMMPIKDGFEFRREQMSDASLSRIPVIVLSADSNIAENKQKLQATHYLKKPIELDSIIQFAHQYSRGSH